MTEEERARLLKRKARFGEVASKTVDKVMVFFNALHSENIYNFICKEKTCVSIQCIVCERYAVHGSTQNPGLCIENCMDATKVLGQF